MELKDLKVLYQKAQISRRDFLRAATIMGISATTAQQLANVAVAQEPKSGGHFIAGIEGGSSNDS
ncbi:MAG: twin-arginine translocation signal domain-containing protein [Deinococcales bacterium]